MLRRTERDAEPILAESDLRQALTLLAELRTTGEPLPHASLAEAGLLLEIPGLDRGVVPPADRDRIVDLLEASTRMVMAQLLTRQDRQAEAEVERGRCRDLWRAAGGGLDLSANVRTP